MKQLGKNELFKNLSGFLKSRGIELTEGSYAKGIQQTCSLLTNAINLGQDSLERAKMEVDKSCAHVRQVIHEKTAPKAPPVMSASPKSKASGSKSKAAKAKAPPAAKSRKQGRR
jgi:hypothetical protein